MRYITALGITFLLALVCYASLIPLLGPTPVTAEYWVRELLIIKRDIVQKHAHLKKLIIASGSSTLFSIDTTLMTKELGFPVINLGLMGGLPLDQILAEADSAASKGDSILLALEPDYYCREEIRGYDEWVLRNAIAWNQDYWKALSFRAQLTAIWSLGFRFPVEMIHTRLDLRNRSAAISARLFALDDTAVLAKYHARPSLSDDIYSVYSLDALGNIRNTENNNFTGKPRRADSPINICAESKEKLVAFIAKQRSKQVSVFFINTPYVRLPDLNRLSIATSATAFTKTLSELAPVLDQGSDLIFSPDLFLNSELHLNQLGRERRTRELLKNLPKGLLKNLGGTN
jgi:hypothetical protein